MLYELTDEDVGEELIAEVGDEDEDDEKREEIAKNVRLAMGGLMTALVSRQDAVDSVALTPLFAAGQLARRTSCA